MNNSIIYADNIDIKRNDVNIIDSISWNVLQNEDWVIIGANGSGKTSLLRSVTGDFWPTTGSLWLFGQKLGMCDLPKLKRDIGWVGATIDKWLPSHESALNIVVTGLHNTYELYHKADKEQLDKAESILNSLGCSHITSRQFGKLSQGEKQKIRLARALINKPKLLILDEVCAGLDISSREDILHSIESLDVANLFTVTHHTEEIPARTTHAIIIKKGRLQAAGKIEDIITDANMSNAFDLNISITRDSKQRIWSKIL